MSKPLVQFNSPMDLLPGVVKQYREDFSKLPPDQQMDCVFLPFENSQGSAIALDEDNDEDEKGGSVGPHDDGGNEADVEVGDDNMEDRGGLADEDADTPMHGHDISPAGAVEPLLVAVAHQKTWQNFLRVCMGKACDKAFVKQALENEYSKDWSNKLRGYMNLATSSVAVWPLVERFFEMFNEGKLPVGDGKIPLDMPGRIEGRLPGPYTDETKGQRTLYHCIYAIDGLKGSTVSWKDLCPSYFKNFGDLTCREREVALLLLMKGKVVATNVKVLPPRVNTECLLDIMRKERYMVRMFNYVLFRAEGRADDEWNDAFFMSYKDLEDKYGPNGLCAAEWKKERDKLHVNKVKMVPRRLGGVEEARQGNNVLACDESAKDIAYLTKFVDILVKDERFACHVKKPHCKHRSNRDMFHKLGRTRLKVWEYLFRDAPQGRLDGNYIYRKAKVTETLKHYHGALTGAFETFVARCEILKFDLHKDQLMSKDYADLAKSGDGFNPVDSEEDSSGSDLKLGDGKGGESPGGGMVRSHDEGTVRSHERPVQVAAPCVGSMVAPMEGTGLPNMGICGPNDEDDIDMPSEASKLAPGDPIPLGYCADPTTIYFLGGKHARTGQREDDGSNVVKTQEVHMTSMPQIFIDTTEPSKRMDVSNALSSDASATYGSLLLTSAALEGASEMQLESGIGLSVPDSQLQPELCTGKGDAQGHLTPQGGAAADGGKGEDVAGILHPRNLETLTDDFDYGSEGGNDVVNTRGV
ncbi:hypothetical protein CBR_g40167 [Chara braunii]|uniref:Uncharacterized protein n=1 Tax=Chara braunii TaxID=69332 RepID=A0A388LTE1_CHABU|nr:hypothetical protein CBR_g40167 [Chara braunii]|eukprot:GBG85529.1 hypothetical protein CBR_g40167 [Chara braunii]